MRHGGGAGVPPHRLHAIAQTTADVVEHAGGRLFDHAMAGWKVTALLPDRDDPRPLHILGAEVGDLETVLTAEDVDETPAALVVAAAAGAQRPPRSVDRVGAGMLSQG